MTIVVVVEGDGGQHENRPGMAASLADALDGLQRESPGGVAGSTIDVGAVDESEQCTPVLRVRE